MNTGFSFANLSITKKIHAITCVAVVAFVVIVLVNYSAMSSNQQSLNELETSTYNLLNITAENATALNSVDELYTQAVTFGDAELLDKAEEVYQAITDNLEKLNSIQSGFMPANTSKRLQDYKNIAASIAKGMIDGTADFSKIQQNAKQKTDIFNSLTTDFNNAEERANARFLQLINETESRSGTAMTTMLIVAVVSVIFVVLLAVVIARGIGNSAKDAAQNLHLLAQGQGSLSTTLNVRSHDEIGQVSINFNEFIALLKKRWLK